MAWVRYVPNKMYHRVYIPAPALKLRRALSRSNMSWLKSAIVPSRIVERVGVISVEVGANAFFARTRCSLSI